MSGSLSEAARALADSAAHDLAVHLLRNVPGLPPIAQTMHLLAIAAVMGSVVMLSLRLLGLLAPSQQPAEMAARVAPWFWCALPILLLTGALFVIARPQRYFSNPVFGCKLAMLAPAIALAALLLRFARGIDASPHRSDARRRLGAAAAIVNVALWTGVVLAGRWIAYADYLFPE